MKDVLVRSLDYGMELPFLLAGRAMEHGLEYIAGDGGFVFEGGDGAALSLMLAELILEDLRPLELQRLLRLLPLSLRDKRAILPEAVRLTEGRGRLPEVREGIRRYIASGALFVPEGFLRFRLQFLLEDWALALDRAGDALLLLRGAMGIGGLPVRALRVLLPFRRADVIIYPDGSLVISDELGGRLECGWADADEACGVIKGLAPDELTVYDLTRGEGRELDRRLLAAFGGRARIFTGMWDG